ncbi:MAG: hypothetical protein LBK75_08765 [Oscillospiraceae bacterium]|nr:hypothetical protein [Oscillospiraceae bacterium]
MELTWQTIAAVAGAVVLLYNAAKVLYSLAMPIVTTKRNSDAAAKELPEISVEVENLSESIKAVGEKLDKDYQRITDLQKGNEALCRAVIALLEHGADSNHKGQLSEAKKGIIDYLSSRKVVG